MGLVAEFEIHCEALPLVEVADAVPAATIEVQIQFNHGDRPPFIVHVIHGSHDAVERALESSSFVAAYTVIGEAGETRRYQVVPAVGLAGQLGGQVDLSGLRALATTESAIERIRATPNGWIQTGWFANRGAFHEFRRFWQENAGFSLRRLGRVGEPEEPGNGLTDPQREALRIAYEMGYYEIPRGASLEAVADELEISPSSLSERLRRAQTHLIETTVASTWPPLPE
ncbi:helix-turn-helix domain-containing protein [Halostagnicola sp. A-GB9-2]|uniref:helix-turn-helix domain-containing protein n=1 Tax=Halostagnicola sp. A-GB9-2 TaxID=3048066 RepID=UPI0024BFF427|nr:helix-turn-helix domain-containing protein [Halostagnicola sp. A-GB9-2]MDJ1431658.1 helix-turn-helix domain-containing protein [Halostagnicola sp. A-GB9-2]